MFTEFAIFGLFDSFYLIFTKTFYCWVGKIYRYDLVNRIVFSNTSVNDEYFSLTIPEKCNLRICVHKQPFI